MPSMRGRRRRKRFVEFRNHQLTMIRHWQKHCRYAMQLNPDSADVFVIQIKSIANNLVHEANKLTEKDWEILLK